LTRRIPIGFPLNASGPEDGLDHEFSPLNPDYLP
jgi:hypothetical protein